MDKNQITKMQKECRFPDTCKDTEIFETHISWVVLTDNHAYKIKRPVRYSFLDFSSLEKRKHFCNEELELNKRTAPDMYLNVIPITADLQAVKNEDEEAEIIDYAVQMRRMDNNKRMDKLLEKDKVNQEDIEKVAEKIAQFHKSARIIKDAFDTTGFQEKYADILNVGDYILEKFGKEWRDKVKQCVDSSNKYLNRSRSYFNERAITGLRRDGHGDLNAANIFLYDNPVIFDCIDFNEEFRITDILNDIAFLSVDLDFYGKENLSRLFYENYLDAMELEEDDNSRHLFGYFKSYRANVEAKVKAISAKKNVSGGSNEDEIKRLLELMVSYMNLQQSNDIPQSV